MVDRTRRSFYPTPSPRESPQPSSAFGNVESHIDFDMSSSLAGSRPVSEAFLPSIGSPSSPPSTRTPNLTEILMDVAPPPWTLTAFMAYLSHNHCMETLEFTLDSQRYASLYSEITTQDEFVESSAKRACAMWNKLMQVYIVPCAPREINLPAQVRDCLLRVESSESPPHPTELDDAGRIIFELMNDSLLMPFIESVGYQHQFVTHSARNRSGTELHASASAATETSDLTDDSGPHSPLEPEPMTPPTTPPTPEWSFQNSQVSMQRAVTSQSKGWKKMSAKLGFSRKATSRHQGSPAPGSNPADGGATDHFDSL